jgi:hypothetical protein
MVCELREFVNRLSQEIYPVEIIRYEVRNSESQQALESC